jgi:hypothetical protein
MTTAAEALIPPAPPVRTTFAGDLPAPAVALRRAIVLVALDAFVAETVDRVIVLNVEERVGFRRAG